ncbi:phylloplanin-like [Cucumis melo var. makuwa]|nr:phylloplanin-like [Cucumis melo var. makuwa]TYK16183.1 phylloplanin-like [Cucumis melo var. makuwa]
MFVMVMVIGALGSAPLMVESQLLVNPLVTINGSLTGIPGGSLVGIPVSNATVELDCNGTVLSTTTTNSMGSFLLSSSLNNPTQINGLLNGCAAVVSTPLSVFNPIDLESFGTFRFSTNIRIVDNGDD